MYKWLVFLHVLGVFGFLMSHGVAASVAFMLRRERNPERVNTLLNLSSSSIGILHGSIFVLLITGIINGFLGKWWGQGWIWVALGLLIAMYVYMGVVASGYYGQVRKAVGLPYMRGAKQFPATEPTSDQEIDSLLNRSHPGQLAATGLGALAIIAWLMVFKPF